MNPVCAHPARAAIYPASPKPQSNKGRPGSSGPPFLFTIDSLQMLSRHHPVVSYFLLTFAISWTAAFLVAAPKLFASGPLPKLTGVLMFPTMLLGPGFAGSYLKRRFEGGDGVRDLFAKVFHYRFAVRWYSALLIPPAMVLG